MYIATGHNNSAHLTFHTTLFKKNRYFVEVEADMPCAYEKHMLMLSNNLAFLDFDLFLFRFRGYNTLFIQYYSVICCPSDHTVGRLRAMQDSNPGRAIYIGRDDLGFLVLDSGPFSCSHPDLVSLLLFTLAYLVLCRNHRSKDLYRSKGKGRRVCLGGQKSKSP